VLNGRYGPYISDGKLNGRIPKDREPASLTLAEVTQLLQDTGKPMRGRFGKKAVAKKAPAKAAKTATAKAPAKKAASKTARKAAKKSVRKAAKKPAKKAVAKPPAKRIPATNDAPF
jgi:DNA topoisomerase-1